MRQNQHERCAVCSKVFTKAYSDFVNGRVVGLLCFLCFKAVQKMRPFYKQGVPLNLAANYIATVNASVRRQK